MLLTLDLLSLVLWHVYSYVRNLIGSFQVDWSVFNILLNCCFRNSVTVATNVCVVFFIMPYNSLKIVFEIFFSMLKSWWTHWKNRSSVLDRSKHFFLSVSNVATPLEFRIPVTCLSCKYSFWWTIKENLLLWFCNRL